MIIEKFIIYVVNLKKDIKRKKHIINELKRQNINNYELIEAVNGNKFSTQELSLHKFTNKKGYNCWNTKMSPSQIGCALSHIKIYKKFLKSNYDFALILEDDAKFINNLTIDLKNFILKNFNYEKQIILLSELKEFYKKPIDKKNNYEIVNVTNAFFTHAYFINKKAAKSIISFNYPVKTIADNFVFFKIYCSIKITGLNPFLVDQDKKNYITTIATEKNSEKIFLLRRAIYKMIIKILKYFTKFKTHNEKKLR
jgi:glycosyl transferase, family 25